MSRITTPIDPVLPVIMLRASGLDWYSSASTAARILRSTAGVKRWAELMYLETVAIETPARAATSRMVGFFFMVLDKGYTRSQNAGKRFPQMISRDDFTGTIRTIAAHRRLWRPRQDAALAHEAPSARRPRVVSRTARRVRLRSGSP